MGKSQLFRQILIPFLCITLGAILIIGWFARQTFNDTYMDKLQHDLAVRARLAAIEILPYLNNNRIDKIEEACKRISIVSGTHFDVFSGQGSFIASSKKRTSSRFDIEPEVEQAAKGEIGKAIRFVYFEKERHLFVAVPFEKEGQMVAVIRASLPMKPSKSILNRFVLRLMIAVLLTALTATILSLVVSHRISHPLHEMKKATERFARGDFKTRLPVNPSLEIGTLAESLNWMAAQLSEKMSTIQHQTLEQEAMLSSMSDGVLAFDNDGRILKINNAAAFFIGLDPRLASGRYIHEVIRNASLLDFAKEILEENTPREKTLTFYQGTERYFQVAGTIMKNTNQNPIGALMVLHDVTEIKKLESMRRDFVANVSHELRTPITSIKGFAETLLEDSTSDKETCKRFLKIIARQADRLHAIIEDLLSLSWIEQASQKTELELAAHPLRPVLESCVIVCKHKAEEKKIHISVCCPENLRVMIKQDLFEQAMINLIDNAIKYSPDNSQVEITATLDHHIVQIAVNDQGPGIPAEHLSRIFERFYRIDKARSRQMGGTGLGLSLVKYIMQAHDGQITVTSEVGKGSCFTLHIPHAAYMT